MRHKDLTGMTFGDTAGGHMGWGAISEVVWC